MMHASRISEVRDPARAQESAARTDRARAAATPLAVAPASRAVLELAERVAAAEVTVMLTGESGVGKEVYARHIHACSPRARGPFVAVNCAAIPEAMLEAVLFGHEKGAFTGASEARPGKFELADGGTLLLDEITEMPRGLQAKLLRALQEREIERLGSARPRPVSVRVLATSNRELREAVRDGVLREDLYYRLNVFPLRVPALRDRQEDILPLARRLLQRHVDANRPVPAFSARAEQLLLAHHWPGNVRELENVVQRALILEHGDVVDVSAIVLEADAPADAVLPVPAAAERDCRVLDAGLREREEELILAALRLGRGSRKEAAERLGISPRTLRYKLARLRAAGAELPGSAGVDFVTDGSTSRTVRQEHGDE